MREMIPYGPTKVAILGIPGHALVRGHPVYTVLCFYQVPQFVGPSPKEAAMRRCSLLLLCMLVSRVALADGDGYFPLYQVKDLKLGLGLIVRSEQYRRFGDQAKNPAWMTLPAYEGKKVSIFGTISDSGALDYLRNRSLQLSAQLRLGHVLDSPLHGHGGGITYRLDKNTTVSGAFSHDHVFGNGAAVVFRRVLH